MLDAPCLLAPPPPIQRSGDASPNRGVVTSACSSHQKRRPRAEMELSRRVARKTNCQALAIDKLDECLRKHSPNGKRMNHRP